MAALSRRMTVTGDAGLSDFEAECKVTFTNVKVVSFRHDLDEPLSDEILQTKLAAKALSVIGKKGTQFCDQLEHIDQLRAGHLGMLVAGTTV
ncbi:MAG: hypothetical protein ACK5LJ_12235 [Paracoccus sp. (in: a-proteobacteria)]